MSEREAEDKAYELWRAGTMGSEACSLNQEAWREGFRAGQSAARAEPKQKMWGHVDHPGAVWVGDQPPVSAASDSPLGIELSKIRDRLNALEIDRDKPWDSFVQNRMLVDRINTLSDASHQSESKIANRLLALEAGYKGLADRLGVGGLR